MYFPLCLYLHIFEKENATYVAQWGTVKQEIKYELFDSSLNSAWNNDENIKHYYYIGERTSAIIKRIPVVRAVRPVLPPAATPALDST